MSPLLTGRRSVSAAGLGGLLLTPGALRQLSRPTLVSYTPLYPHPAPQHSIFAFMAEAWQACQAKACTTARPRCIFSPVAHLHVLQLPQERLPVLLRQVCTSVMWHECGTTMRHKHGEAMRHCWDDRLAVNQPS
jgi:hypothetical protein